MKIKIILSLLGTFILCLSVWHIGFWLGSPKSQGGAIQPESTKQTGQKLQAHPLAPVTNIRENAKSTLTLTAKNGTDADKKYSSLLAIHHLEDKDRALTAIFSPTESGRAISQTLTILKFSARPGSEESVLAQEKLDFLRAHPESTFEEIQKNIPKLKKEYSTDRQFLIQFVSKLNLPMNAKSSFFSEEFLRSNIPFDIHDPSSSTSSVTLSTWLDQDPESVEPVLHQALRQQPDRNTQLILVSIYEKKFPEQAKKLRQEFNL